eukprot:TRINITY_DN10955_c0_g1_i4.p4 TRINITY_DN10955_c0_g1~~TRINITY_DN10955_c0_g1_i4.p4  ORF type:complete len:111 (-),score=6.48 TRINITY_DN10955_c0_g1_i4:246-578(-)
MMEKSSTCLVLVDAHAAAYPGSPQPTYVPQEALGKARASTPHYLSVINRDLQTGLDAALCEGDCTLLVAHTRAALHRFANMDVLDNLGSSCMHACRTPSSGPYQPDIVPT